MGANELSARLGPETAAEFSAIAVESEQVSAREAPFREKVLAELGPLGEAWLKELLARDLPEHILLSATLLRVLRLAVEYQRTSNAEGRSVSSTEALNFALAGLL